MENREAINLRGDILAVTAGAKMVADQLNEMANELEMLFESKDITDNDIVAMQHHIKQSLLFVCKKDIKNSFFHTNHLIQAATRRIEDKGITFFRKPHIQPVP
jgi:hypothetical protein